MRRVFFLYSGRMSDTQVPSQKLTQLEIHRALNRVIVAWVFGAMWSEIAFGAPLVGLFKALGASTVLFGLVGAMPSIATLMQPLGSYTLERAGHRRTVFVVLGCMHRLLWIPLALAPLFIRNSALSLSVGLGILAVSCLLGSFIGPYWFSWVAELVPEKSRGNYFGRRAVLGRISSMLAAMLAGQYLVKDPPLSKLGIVFIVASIAGFADIFIHRRVPDVPMRNQPNGPRKMLNVIFDPARDRSFRAFMIFVIAMWLGTGVAGAYFTLYLMRELALSYLQIAFYMTVLHAAAYILFSWLFGVCVDQFGNKPILILSASANALTPLILVLCRPNSSFLLALMGISSGAAWAGINLAVLNLQIALPPAEVRHSYSAAFSVLTGVSSAIGSLMGMGIARLTQDVSWNLPGIQIQGLQFVLIVSVILRAVSVPFLRFVQEANVKPVGYVVKALRTLNPFRTFLNIYLYQHSQNEERRAQAVRELGRSGALGLREVLSALNDPSRLVREEAARALGVMGMSEGVPALIEKLRDPESFIQSASARSLGKIGDLRGIPPLVETLASDDRQVRGAAASALGEIGDRSAVLPLMHLLKGETDNFVFASGADALGRLGEAQAILIILPALAKMSHPIVRKQLAVAVGNLIGQPGEFYTVLSAEERIEGLGASRLVSDTRRALSRWHENDARDEALQALQATITAFAEHNPPEVLNAVHRMVSAIVEKAFPGQSPWRQRLQEIWKRDEKVGCQLVFLNDLLAQINKMSDEAALLALYALRCLCLRLLSNGAGARRNGSAKKDD